MNIKINETRRYVDKREINLGSNGLQVAGCGLRWTSRKGLAIEY